MTLPGLVVATLASGVQSARPNHALITPPPGVWRAARSAHHRRHRTPIVASGQVSRGHV